MKFTYSSGQRPLDGYTLKRGIGKGGFGEVYFAVSDGGKEVALKLVRDNHDIELRGVAGCLNLKHPNLVALYDLRSDNRGEQWVVMEYIAGESMHHVLGRHPQGLPLELTREWFLALCRAIGYLHDHGLVHRDLKPANVFLENGVLKVGDYGLSKSLGGSQRTAQTQSIGTVHYMAPEISTGNYNKQIDVYAAGVILYEMLTGRVPFDGESAGEILMKHLTAPPDMSLVPADYVPVVSKALNKSAAQRFATMTEMARAVEQIGSSPQQPALAANRPAAPPAPTPPSSPNLTPVGVSSLGTALGELSGSLGLAAVFAALGTALWGALAQNHRLGELGTVFFLTVTACWAVLVITKFWTRPLEDSWGRRVALLVLGAVLGAHALWLDGWTPHGDPGGDEDSPLTLSAFVSDADLAEALAYLGYFAVVLLAVRWWKMTERRRPQRFTFAPILATGFWALVMLLLWPQPRHGAVALVMASAIVQMVSPWEEPPPPVTRRLRLRYA
jgi:eukaryotic-like serine/threonine-protein kinase